MTTDYDDWKTHDRLRELAEDCAEGNHRWTRQGYCLVCGLEADLPPERDDPYDDWRGN